MDGELDMCIALTFSFTHLLNEKKCNASSCANQNYENINKIAVLIKSTFK